LVVKGFRSHHQDEYDLELRLLADETAWTEAHPPQEGPLALESKDLSSKQALMEAWSNLQSKKSRMDQARQKWLDAKTAAVQGRSPAHPVGKAEALAMTADAIDLVFFGVVTGLTLGLILEVPRRGF
jgi:hypothetical protein